MVRACRSDNSDAHFDAASTGACTSAESGLRRRPDGETLVSSTNSKIVEQVRDRFQELLVLDRASYDERLDYLDNFNDAVALLRLTARKKGHEGGE